MGTTLVVLRQPSFHLPCFGAELTQLSADIHAPYPYLVACEVQNTAA